MGRKILFLSALDFKDKSIQVIRKTPEAYVRNGWKVYYIVARDNSKYGNYFYEEEINPDGIEIIRFYWPLTKIRDKIKNHTLRTILNKVSGFLVSFKLAWEGIKVIRNKDVDVLYGYESHGVLASHIVNLIGRILYGKNFIHVVRFQGLQHMSNFNLRKIFFNFDYIIALWLPADLCIMTDDGTRGDRFLKKIKSRLLKNLRFYPNGVDKFIFDSQETYKLRLECSKGKNLIFLTVCRLVSLKRVDRVIEVMNILVNKYDFKDFTYYIIGDGPEKTKLEKLVEKYGLEKYIFFTGAIPNEEVKKYYIIADAVFLTYDISNVGNPLLEAIRANKIVFTLNNGDTGKWIKHKINGFIYDIDNDFLNKMASDVIEVFTDKNLYDKILKNIEKTEKEKLWTWEERLNKEIKDVEDLLK